MKFIFSILLIVISGTLFFVVINPLYKDVNKLRTQVETYNVALGHSTDLQKTRDQLVANYSNIKKEDRDRLEHFLPNTVNNIKFILEIEHIANLHSMPIKNIKFESQKISNVPDANNPIKVVATSDPNASLPYGSFPIEFTTEGDFKTFVQFLQEIEHNLRLVDIKSVSFTVPQQEKPTPGVDPTIYTYNIKVQTYWLK